MHVRIRILLDRASDRSANPLEGAIRVTDVVLAPESLQQPAVPVLALAEALEAEEFVGRVGALVLHAEREARGVRAEVALEQAAHGDRAAAAHVVRLLA